MLIISSMFVLFTFSILSTCDPQIHGPSRFLHYECYVGLMFDLLLRPDLLVPA